jgi:cytochrome c
VRRFGLHHGAVASALALSCACSADADADGTLTAQLEDSAARSAQLERGARDYAARCARCHGVAGGGLSLYPRLVGVGALPVEPRAWQERRTGEFVTAEDVYRFVQDFMPFEGPGSLEAAQYLDIVLFLLDENGVHWDGALEADELDEIAVRPPAEAR